MGKQNEIENQTQAWGTWEELLLACAVHRYGTKSWDSVAMEIQKRSSNLNLLSAQTCKQKFHDLKRRFMDQNDDVSEHNDDDDKTIRTIPWLDELRKLRVAELKREVERYDLSIVSLQLKVKRLKEEREQSLGESEKEREKSDQEKSVEKEEEEEEENKDGDGESAKSSPECAAGKSDAGEESDRDNQSVNESNSTDRKGSQMETGMVEAEEKPEPVNPDAGEPDPAGECTKTAGEDSFNGSSDTIAKESAASPVENSAKANPVRESGDSPELWESMAESKGGGGEQGTKENSDVQSSVKSQPENEDQSPAIKRPSIKSQPLVDCLEIIRSHRLGSVFERRLESQETTKYTSLIRQHIDLETVRTRLEEGWYSDSNRKFFRDLLLLFNNASVFFGLKSSESMAAVDLRQLVSKEIACRPPKLDPSPQEQLPLPPPAQPPPKPEPEPSDSLLVKQKISGPMIACRKRSSLAAKASATSSSGAERTERKREQTTTLAEEKPALNWKQPDKTSIDAEEHRVTKKRTRERFTPTARNTTKNGKSRNKNSDTNLNENTEPKVDKKNSNTAASSSAKKRGAETFLSRMKRSSSSSNGSLLETLKTSAVSSDNSRGGGAEQKKNGGSRSDGRKEQASRKGTGGKQASKEQGSPAKRSVGRPPKRAAAPAPLPPPVSGKRNREAVETEAGGSRQAKKRSRK